MRRLAAITALLVSVPAISVGAADLDELLQDSREASFTAEQVISCATPEGAKDAVLEMSQHSGFMKVASGADQDVELSAGSGGWALSHGDDVASASVDKANAGPSEPLYTVDAGSTVVFLGRPATHYRLLRGGLLRADLVFDGATGALVASTTYNASGDPYCVRKFIQFDPTPPNLGRLPATEPGAVSAALTTDLPESVEGFVLSDVYEDGDGLRFGYYTDGFFSFAVFETDGVVSLPDGSDFEVDDRDYRRSFTAGQVTYVWETREGGMALVGDLPLDLHETVLGALPTPADPGLLRRLWRALFG